MPAATTARPWSFRLEELAEIIELSELDVIDEELDELVVRALAPHLH